MPGTVRDPSRKCAYVGRVRRALTWQRLAVVLLMTTLWSTRRLLTADMAEFFTPLELVLLGVELFAEMAVIAGVLMLSYTLLDEALPPARQLCSAKYAVWSASHRSL